MMCLISQRSLEQPRLALMPSSVSRIVQDDDIDAQTWIFKSRLNAHCKAELSCFLTYQAGNEAKPKYVGGTDLASRERAPGAAADH